MGKDKVEYSGDEAEAEAQFLSVTSYHLEDGDRELVSFAVLPIQWGDKAETDSNATKEEVFLCGFTDNGLKMIMVQVTAWRFDLSKAKPKISLLSSKDKRWIKLQKPRNSYQATIRTILITVHFLHRVKKNPKISAKSVWNNLFKDKELSSYDFKPSRKDLFDHMPLIAEAAKRNAFLAKSKLLLDLLKEKLGSKKLSDEEVKDLIRPAFIVDDIDNGINEANDESEAEDDSFRYVCDICDDGGNVVRCDGPCMRWFHAKKEDGRDSMCSSLGFTQNEVKEFESQSFYCKNCKYNQHQCFACGELGSSDKIKGAEVFKCACATCGHFYHPRCVAKLLPQVVTHAAEELERNIADANSFTCPVHYCCVCKEVENVTEPELQFAVCRRCPKSYHRKCLPREITFYDSDEEDILSRAWEDLLPNNRILIFCLNHEIDEKLRTPIRDHIKFPKVKATVRETNATNEKMKLATKKRATSCKNNVDQDNSPGKSTAKGPIVAGKLDQGNSAGKSTAEGSKVTLKLDHDNSSGKSKAKESKVTGKLSSGKVNSKKNSEKIISRSNIAKKPKANARSKSCLTDNKTPISKKFEMPASEENQPLRVLMSKGSKRTKPNNLVDNADSKTLCVESIRELSSSFYRPGSVDLNGKQIEQWNGKPPLLSLWKHKVIIAQENSQLSSQQEVLEMESSEKLAADHTTDGNYGDNLLPSHDLLKSTDDQEDQASANGGQKSLHHGNVDEESQKVQENQMSNPGKTSCKRKRTEEDERRGESVVSSAKRQAVEDNGVSNMEEQHNREEEKNLTDSRHGDFLSGRDPSCGHTAYGYVQPSSVSESSYKMNAPAIDCYASRLDELNHVRMGSLGSEPPSGTLESKVHQYGYVNGLLGFASGPNLAYSRQNSAGWLNE